MDHIQTSIETSFMGLVRRAPCPVCGATIAINFGFTTLMLCPNCGDYLEVVDKMLRQMDPSSISGRPAFAAATQWTDMHAPSVETFSFATQVEDLIGDAALATLIKHGRVREVDALWPNACCVCGGPPTREENISSKFIFTPPGIIRVRSTKVTIIARGIPHCSEHEHGAEFERAMFSTPGQNTVVGLFFRSYAYQIQFRNLNPWKWTDESELPVGALAAEVAAQPAARVEGEAVGRANWGKRLSLGLVVAAIFLLWPRESIEPPTPSDPKSEEVYLDPQLAETLRLLDSVPSPETPANSTLTPGVVAIQNAFAELAPGEWIANGEFYESTYRRISELGTLSDMRELAESGNSRAQVLMGLNSDYGANGADLDWAEATEWYRRAAAAGEPVAQSKLGWRYEEGSASGLTPNHSEAARLYAASAAQGLLFSQFRLGVFLYEGREGVPQNQEAGLTWLRQAAAAGRLDAQYYLSEHNISLG